MTVGRKFVEIRPTLTFTDGVMAHVSGVESHTSISSWHFFVFGVFKVLIRLFSGPSIACKMMVHPF